MDASYLLWDLQSRMGGEGPEGELPPGIGCLNTPSPQGYSFPEPQLEPGGCLGTAAHSAIDQLCDPGQVTVLF